MAGTTAAGMVACSGPSAAELVGKHRWRVTVYYTAVESFHSDAAVAVEGCPALECANGDQPLGQYPQSFVNAVHDEGAGRITSGPHAGKYLNWSYDIGYWLDSAPRDAHGRPLEPFHSAAADDLPDGIGLRLVDCGQLESSDTVPDDVCTSLRNGQWQIRDQFTPGFGGPQHIDLYIGEEDSNDFTTSDALYVSLKHAKFTAEE